MLTVPEINPNEVLLVETFGGAKLTVFRTLKASARNWKLLSCGREKDFDADRSTFL